MSAIVPLTAGKGFQYYQHRNQRLRHLEIARSDRSVAVMFALAMLGYSCLPPLVTIFVRKNIP